MSPQHADTATAVVDADEVCPEHGRFDDQRFAHARYSCKACALAQDAYIDRIRREEYCGECLRSSGLVGWTERATFDNYVAALPAQKKALDACRALVVKSEKRGETPWLLGPPGTGKTHLGSAMVNYVIRERGLSAAIHSARAIVRMMRASWGNKQAEKSEAEVLDDLANLGLLVIDEVGVSFGSDSELVQLFDVIDLRYRMEKPTALISNLAAKELKVVLGDAAYDRLREGACIVPMVWASHRGGRA